MDSIRLTARLQELEKTQAENRKQAEASHNAFVEKQRQDLLQFTANVNHQLGAVDGRIAELKELLAPEAAPKISPQTLSPLSSDVPVEVARPTRESPSASPEPS